MGWLSQLGLQKRVGSPTILFSVVSDTGERGQAELPIEMAEKLEAQIKEAVIGARMRRVEIALINMRQQQLGE